MGYIFRKIRPKLTPENHPFRRRLRQPLWPDPRCSDDMVVAGRRLTLPELWTSSFIEHSSGQTAKPVSSRLIATPYITGP